MSYQREYSKGCLAIALSLQDDLAEFLDQLNDYDVLNSVVVELVMDGVPTLYELSDHDRSSLRAFHKRLSDIECYAREHMNDVYRRKCLELDRRLTS